MRLLSDYYVPWQRIWYRIPRDGDYLLDVHRLIVLRLRGLLLHSIDCFLISINTTRRRNSLRNGPSTSRILVEVIQISRSPLLLFSSLKIKLILLLLQLWMWPLDVQPRHLRLCWRELLYLAPELLPSKSRRRLLSDGQNLIWIQSLLRLILLWMLRRRVLLLNTNIRCVGVIEVIRVAAVIPKTRGIIRHLIIIWLRLLKLAKLLLLLLKLL